MPLPPDVQQSLKEQIQSVEEADNMSIVADLDYQNMLASINGPPGTPYEGGKITLNISFPNDYPSKPPCITCDKTVWHPNISLGSGAIDLNILTEKSYTPGISLESLLGSIISLLSEPNTSDPINETAAYEYTNDRETFDTKAKEWMSEKHPTSDSNRCMSTPDISTRLALAWCVWNIGQKRNVHWQLDEVMVAILNVHRDTVGRFPEEFDNWSILLKDENERSTHRKVTLHIDPCQHAAELQSDAHYVLAYPLPHRHGVVYIKKQEGDIYHCVNPLSMDEGNLLEIPIDRKGNILYRVSITLTTYDKSSADKKISKENEHHDDHWKLFWEIAPKQDSELERFCEKMHLLGYYHACMPRWEEEKASFHTKLGDLFSRWRRVLRDTTFGSDDGLKLITYMKDRLTSQQQTQSLPGTSQQQGYPSLPSRSHAVCPSNPLQTEDQGQTSTCTRYALAKCVFNSTKKSAKILHTSQSLILTAVLNILLDCHGSWPEEFDDQLFLTIKKNEEGSMVSVNKFAMHIKWNKCADYTPDKEYVLVYVDKTAGPHTVYVEGKDGDNWICQNSWGNYDNIISVPTDAPGNQLYEVAVEEVDRVKKSFFLRERLGPEALKMFLDNIKESIEPKDNQGLQTYCNSMGSFYDKFKPRWEKDNLDLTIRLEEVFEYLWREKYEYFTVQLLSSFKLEEQAVVSESEPTAAIAKAC